MTSRCNKGHECCAANSRSNFTVTNLATGEKVSIKSMPSCWLKPFDTKRALCLSMDPYALLLILKTHLQPNAFMSAGKGTTDQVLFVSNACNSSVIVVHHSLDKAASL